MFWGFKMNYENPASTVDIIIEQKEKVLLIKRKNEPFKDMWALPGGHLDYGKETLEEAAVRELNEETGLEVKPNDIEMVGVYSDPNRDPRGHVISHVYSTRNFNGKPIANDDAKNVRFFPLENLPELAFDHHKILKDYICKKQLKGGRIS